MDVSWLLLLFGIIALSDVSAPQKAALRCRIGFSACRDGSECIPTSQECDGENDCVDGSDEDGCSKECHKGQFQCAHGKKCIDKSLVCDGEPQCQDRSDELECLRPEGCVHQCDHKTRCLPATFICDGEADCADGTDELSCVEGGEVPVEEGGKEPPPAKMVPKCRIGLFGCADQSECILSTYVCDGEPDCPDKSDEAECDVVCSPGQFQCAHGKKCIEQSQRCDGVSHCQDQSDEHDCSKAEGCVHQCDDNSRCLPETFLCDGEKDCLDGTDEANCAESCSNSEFRCASGQCVSLSMQCDGHPDCRDRSDEENCAEPPSCDTDVRCPQSQECLLQDWLCDGDVDCRDGWDEQNCASVPVACGEFQWTCASKTQCVPKAWQCDGMRDCTDGSDEANCGPAVCPSHQFLCGSSECINTALVCNGKPNCQDGSDEGAGCQNDQCATEGSKCAHVCFNSPQGMKCGCREGFQLQGDGVSCVDIDECGTKSLNVCSQSCANTEGSFTCSCNEGYVLESDGHSCKIIGEPYLLAGVQSDLFLLGLRAASVDVLVESEKRFVLSVDYDWQEQRVFWITLNAEAIKWASLDRKSGGTIIKGINADCIAMDWIGRNLYWIDGFGSQINAIGLGQSLMKANDYIPILDEDMEQPHSLALMPEKGLMFWSETGAKARIECAGMDGSNRKVLIQEGLSWPASVTLDSVGQRLYWTDAKLKSIGSATLEGRDIKVFQMMETVSPFSVAVFNDFMIWSDTKRGTIQKAKKMTGKDREVILKRPGQPLGLKVVHAALQTRQTNVCAKHRCSHLCVIAPGPKAVCKCPSHLLLDEDQHTCSKPKDTSFVFVLSPSAITQISLQNRDQANNLKAWPEHNYLRIPNVNEPTSFDFTVKDLTLYLADAGKGSAELFKVKETSLVPQGKLLHLKGDVVTALAVDWISHNLYWSSTRQPRLQVTSAQGTHTAVLIQDRLSQGVDAIALHAPSGHLCFVSLEKKGDDELGYQVECAFMNGRNRTLIKRSSTEVGSLALSEDGSKLFWAEKDAGLIVSAGVDGSGYTELKKAADLTAFAFIDGVLLWVTRSDTVKFWYGGPNQSDKLWFEVTTEVIDVKAYSKASQLGSNQCSAGNGGCPHLCLPFPGGRTCQCAHDHVSDSMSCKPDGRCPTGSKSCLDGQTCVPQGLFCDGHPHCPDHSDENCAVEQAHAGPRAPTSKGTGSQVPTSSPKGPASLAPHSTGSDVLLRKVAGTPCTQDEQCKGNSKCDLETGACTCKSGFKGESCEQEQDGIDFTTIAGAAGGGVVLIVVIAVLVAKRRSASNRRSSAELGETGMSMLQKPENSTSLNHSEDHASED